MCNMVQADNWKTVLSWTHWQPLASDRSEQRVALPHDPSKVFVLSPKTQLRQSWMCCIAPAAGTLLKKALPTTNFRTFKDLSVACCPYQETHAQVCVSVCIFPRDKNAVLHCIKQSSRVQLCQKLSVACGEHGVICKLSFQL